MRSVKQLDANIYLLDYQNHYHLPELLNKGVSSIGGLMAFAADTASTPGTATLAFERTGGAFAVCRSVLRVQCKPHHTRVDGELRAVGETGFLQ